MLGKWWGNRPAEEKERVWKKNLGGTYEICCKAFTDIFSRAEREVFKAKAEKRKGKIRGSKIKILLKVTQDYLYDECSTERCINQDN